MIYFHFNYARIHKKNKSHITITDENDNLISEDIIPLAFIYSHSVHISRINPKTTWNSEKKKKYSSSSLFKFLNNTQVMYYPTDFTHGVENSKYWIDTINLINNIELNNARYIVSNNFDSFFINFIFANSSPNHFKMRECYGIPGLIYDKDGVIASIIVKTEDFPKFIINANTNNLMVFSYLEVHISNKNSSVSANLIEYCEVNHIKYQTVSSFPYLKQNLISSFTLRNTDDVNLMNNMFSKLVVPEIKSIFNISPTAKDVANTYILIDDIIKEEKKEKITESITEDLSEDDLLLINELLLEENAGSESI